MGHHTIELTPQQAEAVTKVEDWYHDSSEQVFRLFGYAGTGKTTIAQHAVAALGLDEPVLYAAYTGKAAYVLRTKGCADADTVHSYIYQPVERVRDKLEKLKKELDVETDPDRAEALRRQIRKEEAKLATPDFILKEESDLEDAALMVLDEVSMVGERMAYDLLAYGRKLLVLGDPAQLPPVDGGGYFIHATPDHLLTEIHRSALDSPVTAIATAVRESQPGDRNRGLDGRVGESGRLLARVPPATLAEYDQVLVGKNATRWQVIRRVRGMYGWTDPIPQPGDRVMVIANNKGLNVFNGQQFTVALANIDDQYDDVLNTLVVDDDGQYRPLRVWVHGFTGLDGEKLAKANGRGNIAAATFAQAITVHKSQGSQWDRVLVVDESSVFAGMEYRQHVDRAGKETAGERAHVAARRWLYTAVTRAAERVTVVPGVA